MRRTTLQTLLVLAVLTLPASPVSAGTLDGTVEVGGIILDEEGDLSAVQETYNLHEGFSIRRIRLNGSVNPGDLFTLEVQELNLDSRRGDLLYRRPGLFKLTAGYDQHRQVFDPERGVHSERKDLRVNGQLTPAKWLSLTGGMSYLARDGKRSGFPLGTLSALGNGYDNTLLIGQVGASVRQGRRGGALSLQISDYNNQLDREADRTGQVISARLYTPCYFYDKWTHMLRGVFGTRKLSGSGLDYQLSRFQYTGLVEPIHAFAVRYDFDASRVDNESTQLKTDRFVNGLTATYFHPYGQLRAGYAYEINDDDRTLTNTHDWRAGATLRVAKRLRAQFDYAGRVKNDQEDLTLLKDVEAFQVRGKLEIEPIEALVIGGSYAQRKRELPDIDVQVDGMVIGGFGRYALNGWGSVSGDYTYSDDEYDDLAAGFETRSHVATGRITIDRIPNLALSGGATYLDIQKDLDIEKSMVFVEGAYRLLEDYRLAVQYNVYNYDDYILLDRYYTANVVQISVGYDLHMK